MFTHIEIMLRNKWMKSHATPPPLHTDSAAGGSIEYENIAVLA